MICVFTPTITNSVTLPIGILERAKTLITLASVPTIEASRRFCTEAWLHRTRKETIRNALCSIDFTASKLFIDFLLYLGDKVI